MKLRNPFKDKWLRWKDDVTTLEKFVYSIPLVIAGMIIGYLLNKVGIWDYLFG